MNFSFYIYGTPGGYNQYPADNNSVELQEFAQNSTAESQLTIHRKGQLVYYAYMRRLQEKTNHFLGFCLVFNGVYCTNPQKLFSLFDRAFDDVLMKGEILKFEKGKCLYAIHKFVEKQVEIDRVRTFFKEYLENDFNRDFMAILPSFKVGNGSKTVSVKDPSSEILAAIAEFDCVHIANNEKSLSELEHTHKLLTDLYTEKQELDENYRKLVAQKKQYKIVLFLCIVVIGCAIGLFAFNKNMQSKDSAIRNLNSKINQQQADIENKDKNIAQLQAERENAIKEISILKNRSQQAITVAKEAERNNAAALAEKDREIGRLNSQIASLKQQVTQKDEKIKLLIRNM